MNLSTDAPVAGSWRVPGLAKGLAVLELLAQSRRGLTLSEVAHRLKLAKSTARNILLTLIESGYAAWSEETGRYFVASRLVEFGSRALCGLRLRVESGAPLRALSEATGLTVHLAIFEQDEVVLVERLVYPPAARIATWVGRHMEVHCTGVGKAILAHLPEPDIQRLIREHGLPRHNENTIISAPRLNLELERIRAQGFAMDDEEDELGFRCVAAPVFADDGVTAAISAVGTTEQITPANLIQLAGAVKKSAAEISLIVQRKP
jgi:DNA-binding IclR family transcriptional regulator